MGVAVHEATPPSRVRRTATSGALRTRRERVTTLVRDLDLAPLAVIGAVVLLGNVLYLAGVFDPNPINIQSTLGTVRVAGVFPGFSTIDGNNGVTAQALGHLAALDVLHGHWPWWNPYEGIGAPLAAEMQSAALFPPNLLLAASGGQLPFHILLEAVAGFATYRLLVRLEIARWIAAGGACAFALNGTFSWFQHAAVNPVAFLPLLILGVERARAAAAEGEPARWALVAVALALSVYAGFPEVSYLDGLLVVCWSVVRLVGLPRDRALAYGRKLVAGAAGGALLAAPILVAFVDYLPTAFVGQHASGFDGTSLPHASIAGLFFPYVFGPIFGFFGYDKSGALGTFWSEVGGYLTAVLLVLGVIALRSARLRPLRIVLAAWIVLGIGREYGVTPFRQVFDVLPAMRSVAAYRFVPASVELAAVVLAALAIDDLRRRAVSRRYVAAAFGGAAAVALLALWGSRGLLSAVAAAPSGRAWTDASIAGGFTLMAAVAAVAILLRGRLRTGLLVGVVVFDALAMFVVPDFSAPRQATVDTALVRWLQGHLGTARFATLGPFHPEYGSYFGVAGVNENDLPIPKAYARYITSRLDPNVIPNIFTGATWKNPSGPTPLEEFGTHLASYEAIGVAYLLASPGQVPPADVTSLHLRAAYRDRVAIAYRLPHPASFYAVTSGRCELRHERADSVQASCRGPATLVRRELSMRGNAATGNGNAIAVEKADGLFQSVRLGPGRTTVDFGYVPPHETVALAAFVLGLVALLSGWWLGVRRRRRAAGEEDPATRRSPGT